MTISSDTRPIILTRFQEIGEESLRGDDSRRGGGDCRGTETVSSGRRAGN